MASYLQEPVRDYHKLIAGCDGAISSQECEQALKSMMNNKAASVSGFTKEFFFSSFGMN